MNGKELLQGMSYVNAKYIDESESAAYPRNNIRSIRRPMLIAAMIAMMLLLVSCAVVYVLRMQNLKIGEETEEKAIYDYGVRGQSIVGYEQIPQQILTLNGLKGTPGYQAALEWYEYKQEYDTDQALPMELEGDYFDYILYNQEMKDKLDEIMMKYGLKPLGSLLEFRTVTNMCQALGIDKLQTHHNDVTVRVDSGYCYSNGNFGLTLDFTLPEDAESDFTITWGNLHWYRKDCFSEDYIRIDDTGDWREWNYTTASGEEVLIIRSASDWRGLIISDRGEALMALQIKAQIQQGNNRDGYEYLYLSDRQLELAADAIDFGIQPNLVSREDVLNQPAASNAATQDGYTVELKEVKTDGYVLNMILGITAPEGTVISRNNREGFESRYFNITPSNAEYLTPVVGETRQEAHAWQPQKDGDGLDNTQDFYIMAMIGMVDGSAPFAKGNVWNLHIEDLVHSYWDDANSGSVKEILAEGEWNFPITFGEENGDYGEIELISEPITIQAKVWSAEKGDRIEDVEVTSFKLRHLSASISSNCDTGVVDFNYRRDGEALEVVMKDGSRIPLVGDETFKADSPIDLEQVDYVKMADGTRLTMPQQDEG